MGRALRVFKVLGLNPCEKTYKQVFCYAAGVSGSYSIAKGNLTKSRGLSKNIICK